MTSQSMWTAASPADTLPSGLYFAGGMGHRGPQEMRNVAPAAYETAPLPNPYDGDVPPQPPARDDPAVSPMSTASGASVSRDTSYQSSAPQSSIRHSTAPSAWTQDGSAIALLSRGTTQASRHSASSSLTDELAGYQKVLEVHHRKEEEDAIRRESRVGDGSGVPADPPPKYSPSEQM